MVQALTLGPHTVHPAGQHTGGCCLTRLVLGPLGLSCSVFRPPFQPYHLSETTLHTVTLHRWLAGLDTNESSSNLDYLSLAGLVPATTTKS